jgi:Protein of unknown function (DUF3060)
MGSLTMMMMISNYSPVLNNWKAFGVTEGTVLTPTAGATSGNDLLSFQSKAGLTLDLGLGSDVLRLSKVINSAIDLGGGQDVVTAVNSHFNTISGGLGDDIFTLSGSYNVLEGGVHGTAGSNELRDFTFGLLPGDRNVEFTGDVTVAPVYLGDNDKMTVTGNYNLLSGQGGDDKLVATGHDNVLIGGFGSDYLTAYGNHNFLASGNLAGFDANNALVRDYLTVRGNDNVVLADSGDSIWVTGGNNMVQLTESSLLKGTLYARELVGGPGNFLLLNDAHTDFSFSIARSGQFDVAITNVDTPTTYFTVAGQLASSGLQGVDAIYTADGYVLDATGISQAANGADVSGLWHLATPPAPEAVLPIF